MSATTKEQIISLFQHEIASLQNKPASSDTLVDLEYCLHRDSFYQDIIRFYGIYKGTLILLGMSPTQVIDMSTEELIELYKHASPIKDDRDRIMIQRTFFEAKNSINNDAGKFNDTLAQIFEDYCTRYSFAKH